MKSEQFQGEAGAFEAAEILDGLDALGRLLWIQSTFGQEASFSTSFGLEDQVLTHLVSQLSMPVRIFTLDTGRLFEQTLETWESSRARYGLEVEVYHPDSEAVSALLREKGPYSFFASVEARKECCRIRKVEPLARALRNVRCWITGLRQAQSTNRATIPIAEWDGTHNLLKVHPLLDWTDRELTEFVDANRVPVNALHAQGYPSVGCAPCTRAVAPGEDIRAGRWWWEDSHKECGLHVHSK